MKNPKDLKESEGVNVPVVGAGLNSAHLECSVGIGLFPLPESANTHLSNFVASLQILGVSYFRMNAGNKSSLFPVTLMPHLH